MSTTNPTPGPQPPADPVLTALQHQTALVQQHQQQMDAALKMQQDQQNMLTGMLPASTAAPQSGAYTVTGSNPFDSQKLAFDSLASVATTIAGKVTGAGPVFIYDQTEINSLVNYKSVLAILKTLQDQTAHLKKAFTSSLGPGITRLMAQPIPAVPGAVRAIAPILISGLLLGGLKTLSDLMGMFRTNTSIAFSSFTPDDVALTAAVVEQLLAKNMTVYEPAVMPIDAIDSNSDFINQLTLIQNDLSDLQEHATVGQAKLQQLSDALGVFLQADLAAHANTDTTKTSGLDAARTSAGQFAQGLFSRDPAAPAPPALDAPAANILKSQRDQFLRELGLFVTSLTATLTAFTTLQTSLLAVTNTGSATLTAILRAEKLLNKVKAQSAVILLLKTSVLGGSVVTKLNLFKGGRIQYTGGAIVNYTLFDPAGKVLASGVASHQAADKITKF